MTAYIFSESGSKLAYQTKVELPVEVSSEIMRQCGTTEEHDVMIVREFMHYHPGADCRYLGLGLWDCGVTEERYERN